MNQYLVISYVCPKELAKGGRKKGRRVGMKEGREERKRAGEEGGNAPTDQWS